MKAYINTAFLVFAVLIQAMFSQVRPSIQPNDLESYTYHFEIVNDRLVGGGADLLSREMTESQFVLLGEYHGSARIGEFTKAIIPILSRAGYRTFGLEIGPISAEKLSRLSEGGTSTVENLKKYNSRYAVRANNRVFTPIPFFGGVEDAHFLAIARKERWNLIGLDQEGSFAYVALIDEIFANLSKGEQQRTRPVYDRARAIADLSMKADNSTGQSRYKLMLESKEINDFFQKACVRNNRNRSIVDAIRLTSEIFHMNDSNIRKYYEANSERIQYMKTNLAAAFKRQRFDVANHKMLLKMGAVHTGRGFSPLSLFEIGNTLSELAEFHGNRSLHIEFGARYFIENGVETDALADENGFLHRYKAFLQMAKRDKWTVIDLRPLRKIVFYQRKFDLNPIILEIFKNQDLYVIPPIDRDATPNYSLQ